MRRIAFAAVIFCAAILRAEEPVPATVEFTFDADAPQGIKTVTSGEASFFKSITQSGGGGAKNGWWHVESRAGFGQGQLRFEIDRSKHAGDLALVLHADWQKDTDVAVQLFDTQGRALALDLFGEMRRNAQTVGTDTFVIPLDRYPDATAIVVRRLSGDLRISGGALFPVLSEMSSKAENEKELAAQLGVILSPHHWIYSAGGKEFPGAGMGDPIGTVHTVAAVEKSNAIGAAILKQPNYPAYRPLTDAKLTAPKIAASGTTYYALHNALRLLAVRSGSETPPDPFDFSSSDVADALVKGGYDIGFLSVDLTSAEKEEFFRHRGYPITELRFAHDALEILVNRDNPVRSLTIPELDAIYGVDLKAGARGLVRDWSHVGGSNGAILAVGGTPGWGTARAFQKLVLQGGDFRKDMEQSGVHSADGVEKVVAENISAIGFAILRPRSPAVRALGIARNSGEQPYYPNADDIYSGKYPLQRLFYGYVAARSLNESGGFQRELVNLLLSDLGQTLVARGGSLPLMASEVVAERNKLGLPQ